MLQTYFCKCTCCYGPDHITNVRRQKPRTYTMATGQSPLTCGNKHNENISLVISLFQIFPRLPSVRTPEVNKTILVPASGLLPLTNADQFRDIYKELLRKKPWVNGEFVNICKDPFPLEQTGTARAKVQVLFHY